MTGTSCSPRNRSPRATGSRVVGAALGFSMALTLALPAGAQVRPGPPRPTTTTAAEQTTTTAGQTTTTTGDQTGTTSAPGGALVPTGLEPGAEATPSGSGESGFGATTLATTAAVAALIGAGVGGLLVGRRRSGAIPPAASTAGAPPLSRPLHAEPAPVVAEPFSTRPDQQGREERDRLVLALLDIGDLVSSEAVRSQITTELGRVGVTPRLVPAGTPFDPGHHRGVGSAPAADPGQDGTVAACDRPGWSDGARIIRLPEVVVHRWEPTP